MTLYCVTSGRDPQHHLVQGDDHAEHEAQTVTMYDIPMYDVGAIFARQLIVDQKRDISIAQPSVAHQRLLSLKSDKSMLIQKLGSIISSQFDTDTLTIDGNQFLDHVVWPVSGTVAGIEATIMICLGMLPQASSHTIDVSIHRYLLEMM